MADCLGHIKEEQPFTGLDPKVLWFILYFLFR